MTRYEQNFCSRCEKKCDPKQLVSLVLGLAVDCSFNQVTLRLGHPGSPKYTTILLICPNCTESYLDWLTCKTEHNLSFREKEKNR